MKSHILLASTGMGFVLLVTLVCYAITNTSGHTGMNPAWLYVYFIPLGIVGLASISLKWTSLTASLAIVIVAGLGMGSLVYLDKTNTLLGYDVWVERGMPKKGEY